MKSKRQTNIFHFKKFSVHHDRVGLKVGTDAVLLGAWVNVGGAKRILDVGTGSGVIALMLAQRSDVDAHIDAVEIEERDAQQARENVKSSPWPNKISVHHNAFQKFDLGYKFDLIVSNPPYFINSLLPSTNERAQARHTQSLSFEEMIDNTLRLLSDEGRLALILPYTEGNRLKSIADSKLYLIREAIFRSRKEKLPERLLLEFGLKEKELEQKDLILYETGEQKSQDYINLTKDFYL
jgi:tRNA1Val (adenine37-N6)-methyltransferase